MLFGSDLFFYLIGRTGPSVAGRILGLSKDFEATDEHRCAVMDAWTSLFPIALRKRGVLFDLYESNPAVQHYPLEDLDVPTLVVNARDDAMSAYDNAIHGAARIPDALLLTFDRGGHLLLDHDAEVQQEVAEFLKGR